MSSLKEQRRELVDAAKSIVTQAEAAGRDLTTAENDLVSAKMADIKGLDAQIERTQKSADLIAQIGALTRPDLDDDRGNTSRAKSLGDHFAKSVGSDGFSRLKSVRGYTAYAPEFKASTDPQLVPKPLSPVLTQVDRTVVQGYRRASVVDLLGTGALGAGTNAVTYFVEGAAEGNFATVAEGAQKPQLHIADPTPRTDAAKKIAGWWDTSDEMIEDLAFWVSEVNNRGLYLLSMVEESQVVNGDGTGTNVLGLLNRSGVQTEAAADNTDNADAIFRAMTKVQTATGLSADGIIIHPTDYQNLRLRKDANDQYYGGGFFAGQYGNGGLEWQPPLWGLRTVVSAAVAQGTAVVGAFKSATTVYRKGGVRVESTNSDLGKFTQNKITTRIEERIALAVRIPAAIVEVTLSDAAAA